MVSNYTETTSNSSISTFHCPNAPNLSWDLNTSTFHFIIDTMALIASPPTIFLNAMVILAIKQKKELRRPSATLLSSLAVTDLLIGVIVMPLSATVDFLILRQISFHHACILDVVNVSFSLLLFFATLYHLTIIAWERYVAIQKWIDYKVIITNLRLKTLAMAAWVSAFFLGATNLIMTVLGVNHRIVEGWLTACAVVGVACLIIIAVFYRKVFLGAREREVGEISQVTVLVKLKLESKVARTTGLLTAALILSYGPIFGFEILGNVFPLFRTSAAIRFTDTVTQLNSLFNPVLYCYRDRRFRNAIRELLGMKKPQAMQSAAGAAPFVRRNDPLRSAELHNMEKPSAQLVTRSGSCNSHVVLDSANRLPSEAMLKKSLSAPTLDKCSSSLEGLELKQPSSILVTSATIHAERGVQSCKVRQNNPQGTEDAKKPDDAPHLIGNKSRSKSWNPILLP